MTDSRKALRAIWASRSVTLLDLLDLYDITEVLNALWEQDELKDDIRMWAQDVAFNDEKEVKE
jgi:hypothetical protein